MVGSVQNSSSLDWSLWEGVNGARGEGIGDRALVGEVAKDPFQFSLGDAEVVSDASPSWSAGVHCPMLVDEGQQGVAVQVEEWTTLRAV